MYSVIPLGLNCVSFEWIKRVSITLNLDNRLYIVMAISSSHNSLSRISVVMCIILIFLLSMHSRYSVLEQPSDLD